MTAEPRVRPYRRAAGPSGVRDQVGVADQRRGRLRRETARPTDSTDRRPSPSTSSVACYSRSTSSPGRAARPMLSLPSCPISDQPSPPPCSSLSCSLQDAATAHRPVAVACRLQRNRPSSCRPWAFLIANVVSSNAGCPDATLAPTAIAFVRRSRPRPGRARSGSASTCSADRAAWQRLAGEVTELRRAYAADPNACMAVAPSPFIVSGQGPWAPRVRRRDRPGLRGCGRQQQLSGARSDDVSAGCCARV